jgi:NDP-sugar pyrophosphorylase family protein
VTICTDTHETNSLKRKAGNSFAKTIVIGEGCWIGMGAMILAGVRIGDGVVVAAGAVVRKDVENGVMVGSVPAEVIRPVGGEEICIFGGDSNESNKADWGTCHFWLNSRVFGYYAPLFLLKV